MARTSSTTRRRLATGLATVAIVASVLSAPADAVSVPAGPSAAHRAPGGDPPEIGAAVGSVPAIQWHACEDDAGSKPKVECATYDVPLDYENPGAGTVHLAVNRVRATGPGRVGSLFLNPGGPGGSGVDFAAGVAGAPS